MSHALPPGKDTPLSDWSTLPSRTLSPPPPPQQGLLSALTPQHCSGQQLHTQLPSAPAVLRKLLLSLQNPSQNLSPSSHLDCVVHLRPRPLRADVQTHLLCISRVTCPLHTCPTPPPQAPEPAWHVHSARDMSVSWAQQHGLSPSPCSGGIRSASKLAEFQKCFFFN